MIIDYQDKFMEIASKKPDIIHRSVMRAAFSMFKTWLSSVHHSGQHLQAYINAYINGFNRCKIKEGVFENLVKRMVVNHRTFIK